VVQYRGEELTQGPVTPLLLRLLLLLLLEGQG
jgi:hypothetical protein